MRHLIKIAMVVLAIVATYYVYAFTAHVAPMAVAIASASSLVLVYVGLAFARIGDDQRPAATAVGVTAMLIEAVYGVLYVLSVQSPEIFAAPLPLWLSIVLAVLHGAPFTILLYFVAHFVVSEQREATPEQQIVATLQAAQRQFLVDMLRGNESYARLSDQPTYPPPMEMHEDRALCEPTPDSADTAAAPIARDRVCKYCGTDGLSMSEIMAHGRTYKRYGHCPEQEGQHERI